ncbi:hypothetical protein MUK42_12542 [Musa troglodytarum]|uniref:Uncharacterized protein n=1 Tax=Musa troglodytarum TaxID=320322 RepID=A0A9E7JLG9_9LILI|nr:hypothetical protein MUK42_12542 [Musa troglodytarum]
MITIYMLFYISMNLGTYTSIVLFGSIYQNLEHSRLCKVIQERFFIGFLFSPMSLISRRSSYTSWFFEKLYLFWCGWQADLYILVSIELTPYKRSIYLLWHRHTT